MTENTILILYEFYYPGYKAGGPVQSLLNITTNLSKVFEFKIATTAYDLHVNTPYKDLVLDNWTEIKMKEESNVRVWYSSNIKPSLIELYKVINSSSANIIYINGFYTNHFLYPLVLNKMGLLKEKKIIISPRGMLQVGALENKALIKKLYLYFLKLTGLVKLVTFHATTIDEQNDIKRIFGQTIKSVMGLIL